MLKPLDAQKKILKTKKNKLGFPKKSRATQQIFHAPSLSRALFMNLKLYFQMVLQSKPFQQVFAYLPCERSIETERRQLYKFGT